MCLYLLGLFEEGIMLAKDLEKIGLTEKEALVYLASLELGESSVQDIATKANVNRATCYVIIEQLQEKEVMEEVANGKKRLFKAAGPYALKNVIRHQNDEIKKKKQKLEQLLPRLKKVHNILPNRAVVRYYEGKESLQSIREQFLESKSKQLHAFFSEQDVYNVFDIADRKKYGARRRKAGIKYQSINNPLPGAVVKGEQIDEFTKVRTVPTDKFYFPCDITVFDDQTSISIMSGQPSGILIESKSIADTFRSIFKLAYQAAEKYQKEIEGKTAK